MKYDRTIPREHVVRLDETDVSMLKKLIGPTSTRSREKELGMTRKESEAAHDMFKTLTIDLE